MIGQMQARKYSRILNTSFLLRWKQMQNSGLVTIVGHFQNLHLLVEKVTFSSSSQNASAFSSLLSRDLFRNVRQKRWIFFILPQAVRQDDVMQPDV